MNVKGTLTFENPDGTAEFTQIVVIAEDTTRIDADARRVAEVTLSIPPDLSTPLPFEIEVGEAVDGLTLRAHMTCHSGNDIQLGDMITTSTNSLSIDAAPALILKTVR